MSRPEPAGRFLSGNVFRVDDEDEDDDDDRWATLNAWRSA
jgi:hypothetical protein